MKIENTHPFSVRLTPDSLEPENIPLADLIEITAMTVGLEKWSFALEVAHSRIADQLTIDYLEGNLPEYPDAKKFAEYAGELAVASLEIREKLGLG